jgi:hypothetical protein
MEAAGAKMRFLLDSGSLSKCFIKDADKKLIASLITDLVS